jgi:hypothetical protein
MNDYRINGKGVGHSPDSFARTESYTEFFDRIGSSSNNIHVINNFISQEDAESLINLTNRLNPQDAPGQWSEMIFSGPEVFEILDKYKEKTVNIINERFGVNSHFCGGSYLVKWGSGKKMDLHVDDLGSGENHLSAVLYINEDYSGGSIVFPTHNLHIKPKKFDLIIFPGNLNYAHEVTEVISGTRFTVPFWTEID